MTESSALRTLYSSVDAVGKDGKVLQVRVGNVVLQALSGSFWTLPLKEGTSGEADVERDGVFNPRSVGNVVWKAVAIAGGQFRVDAKVSYSATGSGGHRASVYGNWTATDSNQNELPESSSAVLRGTVASGMTASNLVSVEFKPR